MVNKTNENFSQKKTALKLFYKFVAVPFSSIDDNVNSGFGLKEND